MKKEIIPRLEREKYYETATAQSFVDGWDQRWGPEVSDRVRRALVEAGYQKPVILDLDAVKKAVAESPKLSLEEVTEDDVRTHNPWGRNHSLLLIRTDEDGSRFSRLLPRYYLWVCFAAEDGSLGVGKVCYLDKEEKSGPDPIDPLPMLFDQMGIPMIDRLEFEEKVVGIPERLAGFGKRICFLSEAEEVNKQYSEIIKRVSRK